MKPEDHDAREADRCSRSPLGTALFRTTLETMFTLPTFHDRSILQDWDTRHALDTVELGKVLEGAEKKLGRPLDLLGMDACLMSNLRWKSKRKSPNLRGWAVGSAPVALICPQHQRPPGSSQAGAGGRLAWAGGAELNQSA